MKSINYPKVGKLYKHYKGGTYRVLTLANHADTKEILVIYQSIEFSSIYARPLNDWFDDVTTDNNMPSLRFSIIKEIN